MLGRTLRQEGWGLEEAATERAGLVRVAAQTPDLILLDLMMPGLDGYGVLVHVRADEALRHIPVIVLSASDETDSAVRCIEPGDSCVGVSIGSCSRDLAERASERSSQDCSPSPGASSACR
jgi:CheY-like chemotaxis protein